MRGLCAAGFLFGTLVAAGQDTWVQHTPATSPSARFLTAMAFDALHGNTVLFGGSTLTASVFSDTWVWDGTSWTERNPATSPAARSFEGLVYDALHQQVVLFGGGDSTDTALSDTWVWDGTTWTQKIPATSPPARRAPSMAYDAARQQVVVFGGINGSGCLSDTWVWDGTTWTQKHPATHPAPSFCNNTMTYDAARQQVVLLVGETLPPDQTWLWDGTNWTLETPTTGFPQRTALSQLVYDSARQRTIEFGGDTSSSLFASDTWTWDGTNWVQLTPTVSPSARGQSAMAYDSVRQQVVLFGGYGPINGVNGLQSLFSDTWTLASNVSPSMVTINVPPGVQFNFNGVSYTGTQNITIPQGSYSLSSTSPQATNIGTEAVFNSWSDGGAISHTAEVGAGSVSITGNFSVTSNFPVNWVQQTPASSPAGRFYSAMAYDVAHKQSVLFGGAISSSQLLANDTWVWDGFTWTQKTPATSPPARLLHAMAYDALHDQVVLFGGSDGVDPRSDTWVWDGTTWTQKTPATVPTARVRHSLAYDETRQRVVLTGGEALTGFLVDTWVWDGSNWTNETPAVNPPISYSALAYDEARQNVVRFVAEFNTGTDIWGAQTWTWDGAKWTQTSPASTPSARILDTSLAYLAATQKTLLFAGSDAKSNVLLDDTWLWDGANWNQLSPATSPSARFGYAFDYDSNNHEAVLFGGLGPSTTVLSDTWLFADAGTPVPVTITVPAGVQFTFNGTTYTGTQTIKAPLGSLTLSTNSPQATGAGTRAVFLSWSDGGAASHSVNVNGAPLSIIGSFKMQYLLTTLATPAGLGTVSPPSEYVDQGTTVTVTEMPGSADGFTGWSGACSGTGACSVMMNAPASVTATFKDLHQVVTILVPAGIQFTLSGFPFTGPQTLSLLPGTYLLSTPSPQSTGAGVQAAFVSWSDGGAQSHNLAVASNSVTVTGTFKTQYQLSIVASPAIAGSVSPASGTFYDPSTAVVIEAAANAGYFFQYFSGACSGSNPFCLVIMTAPQTVTANFSIPLNWVQIFPATSPSAEGNYSIAYDSVRNQMVMLGETGTGPNFLSDTWIWDGANWSQRTPLNSPPGRTGAAMAFDARNGQVVMFGGLFCLVCENQFANDTWVWDGANWTQKTPANSPSARYGSAMVFDQGNNQAVLFGGFKQDIEASGTWVWDGANWTQKTPANSPSERYLHAMAYDAARRRLVLFGGSPNSGGPLADTWEWDGSSWTLQKPSISPPARAGAVMMFDAGIQQVVLFGGDDASGKALNDTWVWNGSNWTQVFPVTSPPPRESAAGAYDSLHQQLFLFGGVVSESGTPSTFLNDTWIYLPPSVNIVNKGVTVAADAAGNNLVTVTLNNGGNIPLNNIFVLTAKLGSTNATSFTSSQFFTDVAPGASVSFTAKFPPTTVSKLTGTAISFTGSYSAGSTIGAAWTVSVR